MESRPRLMPSQYEVLDVRLDAMIAGPGDDDAV